MRWCDVLLSVAAVVMLCGAVRDCGRDEPAGYVPPVMDTLVFVDTVRYYMPVARDSVVVRYATVRVARADKAPSPPEGGVTEPMPLAETLSLPQKTGDSVDMELPITQLHYADTTYEAWVSGYAPQLDSIYVFPKREIVTTVIKQPPKRWHIGIQAGAGITPCGVQPFVGVGLTYSFLDL